MTAAGGGTAAAGPRVCVLHTVAALPAVFDPLLRELAPGVRPYHVVDESLLADTVAHGPLPRTAARLAAYVTQAEAAGADAVLVTCSSIGPAAEQARPLVSIPVLRVDEPMAASAVSTGARIAVLATLESTLAPTADLIRRQAGAREITLTTSVCPGSYAAKAAGDAPRHDTLIAEEALRLAADHDVLVLAQASMAGALDRLPQGALTVPVLTSTRSGTAQLAAVRPAAVRPVADRPGATRPVATHRREPDE
ncbi:aspartate/glutamate racemase family protein [Streptomyces montanisoli]|uniref:Aspartate/glutamate racemase family protein n=1 Tax=Streptomyces montanisoli TaxID=2798581 RepID=A0A940MDW3_9ACTN|nr:aspartate/glutamate racemase family protein [Streptomyces montanisoli]MBP0456888.1 aspartate/glutamate racemase family protein [Streptomyces montanisoli]